MASIRKRGKTYQIRVSCGYDLNRRQIVKTMTYKPSYGMTEKQIRKEVERQAVLFEEKCKNGEFMSGSIRFADFAERWFEEYAEKQLKAKTVSRYRDLMSRVIPFLGHLKMDKIQPYHLIDFYNSIAEGGVRKDTKYTSVVDFKGILKNMGMGMCELARTAGVSEYVVRSCVLGKNISGESAEKISRIIPNAFEPVDIDKALSDKTVQCHHGVLSSVFSTAVQWQVIASNPCKRVKAPKAKKKEALFLDEKQAKRLVVLLENEPIYYRTIISLFLYTGMRRGELCGLEWSDIDFKNRLISITKSSLYISGRGVFDDTPKNKSSERVIKIPPVMIELLREHQRAQNLQKRSVGKNWAGSDKVFTNKIGAPINPDTITWWFHKFVSKHNLPNIHIHSLRHTNATLLIAGGTDIRTVAKRLGHANISVTGNVYAHALKSADAAAAKVLSDMLLPSKRFN